MTMRATSLDRSSEVSVAAIRRSNRTLLLSPCLPLIAAFTVTIGIRGVEYLSRVLALRADRRLGNLNQSEAVAVATTLCTRITGAPADVLDATSYTPYANW